MAGNIARGAAAADAARASASRMYYGYWLVIAAFVAQFVAVGAQNYVIGPFLKPMTADLGWTRSDFTIARTVGQFVMAFTGFFIGGYVDRAGGRRLMQAGAVVTAGSLFALSYTQTLWHWIVLNGIVMTVGAAMIGNLVVNVTLAKWFVEKRGRAIGLASMGVSFAGVALVPVMTQVIDEWGWRAAWRVLAVGSLALVVPVSFLMRRAPEDYGLWPDGASSAHAASARGLAATADFASSMTRPEALRTAAFYLLVVAFGMFGVTIGVILLQTIPFMTDAGYSRGIAALMITVASVPALVSKPFWGMLIDKTDARRLAAISATVTGIAMILIVQSVRMTNDPLVYFAFFLLGCGWGGMIPIQEVIWATFFGRRHLGAVRSAGLPFSLVFGAGAPQLVSIYFDRVGDYNGAFLAIAGLNIGSAALVMLIRKPTRGGRGAPLAQSGRSLP